MDVATLESSMSTFPCTLVKFKQSGLIIGFGDNYLYGEHQDDLLPDGFLPKVGGLRFISGGFQSIDLRATKWKDIFVTTANPTKFVIYM